MSRSDGACVNWTDAATPIVGEAADVLRREQLGVLDALAEAERLPDRAGLLEGIERIAVRAISDRVHRDREPAGGAAAHDLRELLAARDLHAASVEEQRGLRAERPVHEDLEVTEREQVVAEARAQAELVRMLDAIGRDRLPHAQRERRGVREALPETERPSQPSLSWTAVTPREAARRTPSRIASTYSSASSVR